MSGEWFGGDQWERGRLVRDFSAYKKEAEEERDYPRRSFLGTLGALLLAPIAWLLPKQKIIREVRVIERVIERVPEAPSFDPRQDTEPERFDEGPQTFEAEFYRRRAPAPPPTPVGTGCLYEPPFCGSRSSQVGSGFFCVSSC